MEPKKVDEEKVDELEELEEEMVERALAMEFETFVNASLQPDPDRD